MLSTCIGALLPNLAVGLHLGRWSLIACIHCMHACLSPLFHGGGGDSRQRAAAATAVTAGTCPGSRARVRPCRCCRTGASAAGRHRCRGCQQSSHRPSLDALGENTKAVISVLSLGSSHRSEALYYATTVLKQHGWGINFIGQETLDYSICTFKIFFTIRSYYLYQRATYS